MKRYIIIKDNSDKVMLASDNYDALKNVFNLSKPYFNEMKLYDTVDNKLLDEWKKED